MRHPRAGAGVRSHRGLAQAASEVGGYEGGSCDRLEAGKTSTTASAHIPSVKPAIVHPSALRPRRLAMTAVSGASARLTTIEVARMVAGGSRYPIRAKPEVTLKMFAAMLIVCVVAHPPYSRPSWHVATLRASSADYAR